ncbi:MAG: hypothetical protein B6D35_08265 [Candidatus Brocadia sp. UTAMX2]|jgi:hypothetical protein|nr:MAG: hypothetical protein B6D35_08265 [Candidatus Brocadia sp. UTAMX2]
MIIAHGYASMVNPVRGGIVSLFSRYFTPYGVEYGGAFFSIIMSSLRDFSKNSIVTKFKVKDT